MLDQAAASRIRLLGLDVDGVLTENDLWIGSIDERRVEFKRFDVQDGYGIRLLRGSDIGVFWLTGRKSENTMLRAKELKIEDVLVVPAYGKVPALQEFLDARGIRWDEVAFMGDDIPDTPVLRKVGFPVAVANARDEVKALAAYVTDARGGHGAVREVIDLLLKARGEWDAVLARFFAGDEAGPE